VTFPRPHRTVVALAVVAAAIVVACGTANRASPSAASLATLSAEPTAALTPVPGGSAAPSSIAASPPSQTDTEWGRIWDALPPGFPLPADAAPTQTGEEGPVSGSFAVGDAAPNVATFMQNALKGRGFSIESVEGPSEDGSFTVNAVGADAGCLAQVRIRPLSGTTNLVVLYGASCPFG
jgi:hypothetical protein